MNLRSFDIFRKIQSDIHPGTRTGGIFTVFAFIIGGLLLFHSLNEFYTEKYTTSLIIENDDNPVLPVQINIVMSGAPCHSMHIKFHDQHQYEEGDLQRNLTLTRIKANASEEVYSRKENRDDERNQMRAAIEAGEACRMNGTINMPKTPGYLKVELSGNGNLLRDLHDILHKVKSNYKLNVLQFGNGTAKQIDLPVVYQSESIKKYIMDLEGRLTTKEYIQDFSGDTSNVDFLNHIKVIPVRYGESKTDHSSSDKYRYSIRSGKSDRSDALPSLTFLMQIEPINIVYHKLPRSRYQLVVRIFAIIGGVFATIGIVNSLVQAFKEMISSKAK